MPTSAANTIKVGFVQIAELNWAHRRRERFQVRDGLLTPKVLHGPPPSTSFVYIPYSVGLLQAYAQKHAAAPGRYEYLLPIYRRIPVALAVSDLLPADVVGFSVYVWNINQSLQIARQLKQQRPEVLIVFGGPQVPDHAEEFLRQYSFVDVICHGEGESTFLQILERFPERDWEAIPGVSYLAKDSTFFSRSKAPRMTDLSASASPYLDGVFDPLMAANADKRWLVMWETNRGCPFACTFCDWGSAIASKVHRFEMERLKEEAEWFARNKISHIFVCDANFGILPRDVDIAKFLVQSYERHRTPFTISVQNTKNATERSYTIHKIFSRSTVGATLSLQSVDSRTLEAIKRSNISLDSFNELQRRFRGEGIETYTDIIVGLPGETYDSFAEGVSKVIENGQHNRIAFYNCSVLPNAEMGDPTYQRRYAMEYVPVQIIHEHESLDNSDRQEVTEFLNIVVATASMTRDDWVRAKSFAWMVELLHFNRVLQIVFVTLANSYPLDYRALIEAFLDADAEEFPVFSEINEIFVRKARDIQAGNPEYIPSTELLNIWWPADQYALIKIVVEGKLTALYEEAERILTRVLEGRSIPFDALLLHEAIELNRSLLRMPNQRRNLELRISYNIWEFYHGVLTLTPVPLEKRPSLLLIDRTSTVWLSWQSWSEDVITQMYKRNDYLYGVKAIAHPSCVEEPSPAASTRPILSYSRQ